MKMRRWLVVAFVSLFLPAAAQLPTANPERVGLSPERLDRITAYFANEIAEKRLPGAVILVASKGRIAYFESFGTVDPATGAPMTKDSIFRLWSLTKPFVAVATMSLVEEGGLSLSDPVSKYLPEFAKLEVSVEKRDPQTGEMTYATVPAERQVTLYDLLRHTSGISYGTTSNARVNELYNKVQFDPLDISSAEFAGRIAKLPLAHQPGAVFEYSYSYHVLGRVLEVVTGMRLSELLEKRVFAPLSMRDSAFHVPAEKRARLAQPFATIPGTGNSSTIPDATRRPAMDAGGGNAVGTAGDYARFLQMILNGGQLDGRRIVSRSSVRLMTSDHLVGTAPAKWGPGVVTFNSPGYTYGLGFGLRREAGGASVPGSAGEFMWTGYGNLVFFVDPQQQLIAIFMSAGEGNPIRMTHRRAFRNLVYQAIAD